MAAIVPDPPPGKDFRQLLRSVSPEDRDRVSVNLWDSRAYYAVFATNNRQPLPSELLAQLQVELVSNAPLVELLIHTNLSGFGLARNLGWIHDRQDFSGGDHYRLRHNLTKTLALQSVCETELGNGHRAAAALVAGFQVDHMPFVGSLCSELNNCWMEHDLLAALERTLNRVHLSGDDLLRLNEAIPQRCDLLRQSLLARRAWQIAVLNEQSLGDDRTATFDNPRLARWHNQRGSVLRSYQGRLKHLDRSATLIAAAQLPWREQREIFAAMDQEWLQAWNQRSSFPGIVRVLCDRDYAL